MKIEKALFEQYRSKKDEIKELEYVIKNPDNCNAAFTNYKNLNKECEAVEEYIESVSNSQTRRILRMRYIEGKSLQVIGNRVHMDKSTVSRKISNLFKDATHTTNATL